MLGNGEKQTSLCFIQDVVDALILAVESEKANGKTYFVTDNHIYSWQEMLLQITRILNGTSFAIKIPFPFLYTIAFFSELMAKVLRTQPLISRQRVCNVRRFYYLFNSEKIQKERRKKMNVLVTGATGFLGRRLAFKLAEKGYIIHALYRSEEKASQLKHHNIKLFKGDITVPQSIGQAVRSCKQVYHLAAFAKVWEKNKDRVYQLNVQGTLNTIHAAFDSGVEKIVFISTAGVFGPCSGKEVSERTEYPDDFFTEYERTKCQAEKEVLNLVKNGKNIVIVNPTRIYGPGLLRESNSLTKIVKLYLEGKWHVIPGNGKSIGNYVYIDDVVNGMISAMENGKTGERYILGGVNVSYNELFSTLKDVSGKKNFIIKIPFFVIHTLAHLMMLFSKLSGKPPVVSPQLVKKFSRNWAVSSSKAVNELGYKITPLREGLSQTIAWLKSLKV